MRSCPRLQILLNVHGQSISEGPSAAPVCLSPMVLRLLRVRSSVEMESSTGDVRQWRSWMRIHKLWVSIGLHALLVMVHIGFLVLYYLPLKANTILAVPPGKAKKILSEGLTALVQSVALAYFAVLVLLTQQLATRRMLHMRQSLTTIHDKAAAWSGMGSAVTAVFRQIFVPSQSSSTAKSGFIVDVGVVVIALYLGCIHILHITTPSAFAVQDLPARHTKNQSYVQRLLEENEPVKLPLGRTQASLFLPFEDAIKILPILPIKTAGNTTVGLWRNYLYATTNAFAQDDEVVTSSSVSYTAINVRCAPLSTQQIGYNTTANAWVISSQIRNDIITPFGPNTVRILPIRQNSVSPDDDPWNFPGILIYASLNITDSRGVNGTTIRLDPPIMPFMASNYSYTDIQVITCNIRTNASDDPHIFIDTHTQLVDYSETEKHSFTTLPPSGVWLTTPDISPRNNTLEADWAAIFNVLTVPSQLQVTDQCLRADDVDDTCQVYSTLTTVEKYINDRLGLEPPSAYDLWSASKSPNDTIGRRSVSLSDLEQALENATAAIYWASDTGPKRRKLILATVKRKVGAQVTLHPIPLIVGLVASITLLCLAIHIGWEPHSEIEHTLNPDLEGLGLLQLVWLLAQHSYVQDELVQVKTPSTKELRRASRFQVHFDMLRTAPMTGLELTDDKELRVAVQEHTVT